MRLFCFTQHLNAVERMLGPHLASIGEVIACEDLEALKRQAANGDVLIMATAEPQQPDPKAYDVARAARMHVWALSDHWAKADDPEAEPSIEEPPAAPVHAAAAQGMVTEAEQPTAPQPEQRSGD